jgi:ferritin-like metal-binding protein YciE
MFSDIKTLPGVLRFRLGAALRMEEKVLGILLENTLEAEDDQVKLLFRRHHEQTRGHVAVVLQAFEALEWEADDSPSPAIAGLEKGGKALVRKSAPAVVDAVLLQSAVEVEHHEIAVYENLMSAARAIGRDDVAELLRSNLEQEQQTLAEVRLTLERVAAGPLVTERV